MRNDRGRRNLDFRKLICKERISRKFRDKLTKLKAGHFRLSFAQGCQRQQDLRKRPQIMPVIGDLELFDSYFLVAVGSGEAKEKSLDTREIFDDVIRRAQSKIVIGGVWGNHQQFLGAHAGFANLFQAVELGWWPGLSHPKELSRLRDQILLRYVHSGV